MQYILVVEVVLCFGAQLFGLCRFSAFFHKLNAFYVAIHFIGTVAVLFFCFQNWEWKLYWNIAILCSGVPFVLEMLTWMLVCWLTAMHNTRSDVHAPQTVSAGLCGEDKYHLEDSH